MFIPGDQEESYRGCSRCSLAYLLEASTIHRDCSDSVRSLAPIRIIRSPAVAAYELMDPVTVQGRWSARTEYNVVVRHQAVVLGGLIPVQVQLAHLCSGAKIIKARFYLLEQHTVYDESVSGYVTFDGQRQVAEWPLALDGQTAHFQSWSQCLDLPELLAIALRISQLVA